MVCPTSKKVKIQIMTGVPTAEEKKYAYIKTEEVKII
jgi:hypothetical protein